MFKLRHAVKIIVAAILRQTPADYDIMNGENLQN